MKNNKQESFKKCPVIQYIRKMRYANQKLFVLFLLFITFIPTNSFATWIDKETNLECEVIPDEENNAKVKLSYIYQYPSSLTVPNSVVYEYTEWVNGTKVQKQRNYTVTCIDFGGEHNEILSVTIPETVTTLLSFTGCKGVKSLTIPENVTAVHSACFSGCKSLESVNFQNTLTTLESVTFNECENLQSVVFPQQILAIGNWCFSGCKNLREIKIPNTVKELGYGCFENCENLCNVEIGSSVEKIYALAFSRCNSLEHVTIPNSVKEFVPYIAYGFLDAGYGVFNECENLSSISLSDNLQTIPKGTFSGCSKLDNVVIPNSVVSLESGCFGNCEGLRNITIGKSVKEIDGGAFSGCSNLTDITFQCKEVKAGWLSYEVENALQTIKFSESCTAIGRNAFRDCLSLSSISFSKSIKSIGTSAFSCCRNLQSIDIPNSVTIINSSAFSDCESLTRVSIPNSISKIEDSVFRNCYSLSSIHIPNTVWSIGNSAFSNCVNLKSVTLPNSLTSIGSEAFLGCNTLSSVSFPQSLIYIDSFAFYDCSGLTSVSLPGFLQYVGSYAFHGTNITKIYCYATTPPTYNTKAFDEKRAVLFVPYESITDYARAKGWKTFNYAATMSLLPKHDFFGETSSNERVKGVTADGLTQLDVLLPSTDNVNNNNAKLTIDYNGVECTDKAIIGTWSNIKRNSSSWLFTFTAPDDFPQDIDANSYTINATVTIEENGLSSLIGGTQIRIYRPGVLLLHGLGSDATCFAYLKSYLIESGKYEPFQVINGSYKSSNTDPFKVNTYDKAVVQIRLKQLYQQMRANGIVSSKYDLVGHSMGGILSRLYAQDINAEGVNRIITLNTPHSGSQLGTIFGGVATELTELKEDFEKRGILALTTWGYLTRSLEHLIRGYNTESNNAVVDLSPLSSAIKHLNSPNNLAENVPVHAICSYMTDSERDKTNYISSDHQFFAITPLECVSNVCSFFTDEFGNDIYTYTTMEEYRQSGHKYLDRIFHEEKHDGIVPFSSQTGGLDEPQMTAFDAPYIGPLGLSSNAHHVNVHHWNPVCERILCLLYEQKSSPSFSKTGFHPVDLSAKSSTRMMEQAPRHIVFNEPSDSTFIKIEATKSDTARVLQISVSQSNDVLRNLIFSVIDSNRILLDNDTLASAFRIPDNFKGDLVVFAIGRTKDNALVADSIAVHFDSATSLSYLYFEDKPSMTMTEGQYLEPNVVGGWTNGEECFVSPVFSTDKNEILEIEGALITAKSVGEGLLFANYEGLADTIVVHVDAANITDAIQDVTYNKPSVSITDDIISINLDPAYKGLLATEIYNMAGYLCYQRYQQVASPNTIPIAYDISALKSQLYIIKICTNNGIVTHKFYKE